MALHGDEQIKYDNRGRNMPSPVRRRDAVSTRIPHRLAQGAKGNVWLTENSQAFGIACLRKHAADSKEGNHSVMTKKMVN